MGRCETSVKAETLPARRKYSTDDLYLNSTPESAIDKIRKDRLLRGWSAKTLAKNMGVPLRKVRYYEERGTPDDLVDLDYLERAGEVLREDKEYYFDDYLFWSKGMFQGDINRFLKETPGNLEDKYGLLGAGECAVTNWKKGKSRPPRVVFQKLRRMQ